MTTTRKVPHCKTCYKPLKGHKRGICDPIDTPQDTSIDAGSPTPTRKRTLRKSEPLPQERVPTLSPQSSQILGNILRTTSRSAPSTIQAHRKQADPAINDAELLHLALETLSTSDKKKSKMPCTYPATESEDSDTEQSVTAQDDASTTSLQVTEVKQELPNPTHGQPGIEIQKSLDIIAQSAASHSPATIFSFPEDAVPALRDGVQRLGLFVHVLPLPSSNERWVSVVVGRDERAVAKLLEDNEVSTQPLRKSRPSHVPLGLSHVVAVTLGALAVLASLAYV